MEQGTESDEDEDEVAGAIGADCSEAKLLDG